MSTDKIRCTLVSNVNQKKRVAVVLSRNVSLSDLSLAKNKLRIKAKRIFDQESGEELISSEDWESLLKNDVVLLVSQGEDLLGRITSLQSKCTGIVASESTRISSKGSRREVVVEIAARKTFIEDEALKQLYSCAERLSGVVFACGMADLHPGKGYPIGCAIGVEDVIYPFLIGNDIGCGMTLIQTDLDVSKAKVEKWLKALHQSSSEFILDVPEDEYQKVEVCMDYKIERTDWPAGCEIREILSEEFSGISLGKHHASLGTIGRGNHFAELQVVDSIIDFEAFSRLGLKEECFILLVHSGSRGLGAEILRKHTDLYGDKGLLLGSEEAKEYLACHDGAVLWAKKNRCEIARKLLGRIGANLDSCRLVLDISHNSMFLQEDSHVIVHRKGAAPRDQGPIVIPGSRGSLSFLVMPTGDSSRYGCSLPHGAGRKWQRSKALSAMKEMYPNPKDLLKTAVSSYVVCTRKDLLYEEAPEAYKDITEVISDIGEFSIGKVVATLKPVITYKSND